MKDRFIRGLIAGIIAGISMDILDLISYWLKIDNIRYLDFAAIIAFNKVATGWFETSLALIIELFFKGLLGVVFIYLIPQIHSKYLLIKGIIFGVSTWFIIYGVIVLLNAPKFPKADIGVTLSHLVNASVYGIVFSQVIYWMNNRIESRSD